MSVAPRQCLAGGRNNTAQRYASGVSSLRTQLHKNTVELRSRTVLRLMAIALVNCGSRAMNVPTVSAIIYISCLGLSVSPCLTSATDFPRALPLDKKRYHHHTIIFRLNP